jgi:hypothetical protein
MQKRIHPKINLYYLYVFSPDVHWLESSPQTRIVASHPSSWKLKEHSILGDTPPVKTRKKRLLTKRIIWLKNPRSIYFRMTVVTRPNKMEK